MSLTTKFVRQIMQSEPLKERGITELAVAGVIDYFASSLQAQHEHYSQCLLNWIKQEGGIESAYLVGRSTLATARQAALFNGYQAHALDYDDVHSDVRGHPSAVILSALLSSIELNNISHQTLSGQRFLSAYVVGIEVMAQLGIAIGSEHYSKGWHNTATLGGIAATAAICYLHQYDFTDQALALASTQSSGLRLLFGTPIKPLHAGLAAQNALQSIDWIKAGLTANRAFLDEQQGFLAVYGQGNAFLDLSCWGKPWRIAKPGLWFKNYPYCSGNSYVADATLELIKQCAVDINHIKNITVIFPPKGDEALIYKIPELEEQGRFSAEYIIALILLGRTLDESAFRSEPIASEVISLMEKITREYRTDITAHPDALLHGRFVIIRVELKNGDMLQTRVDFPKGSPKNPYSSSDMQQKLIKAVGSAESANEIYSLLSSLATNNTVNNVISTLLVNHHFGSRI